jgi:hypothetical protein
MCDVSWSPNHNPFQTGVPYTVMVTLTASTGNEFDSGLAVRINGRSVTVNVDTGGVTATASYTFSPLNTSSTTPIPMLNPAALVLLMLMLGLAALRRRV